MLLKTVLVDIKIWVVLRETYITEFRMVEAGRYLCIPPSPTILLQAGKSRAGTSGSCPVKF